MAVLKEKDERKLSSFYTYNPLSKYEGLPGKMKCRAPTTYVGVEVELEKIHMTSNGPSSVSITNDGSLKLDGKEFITIPIRFFYLEQELNRLFSSFKSPHVSSRCSIHVHMNARDFTQAELYRFILLYLIFEKSLFNFSGDRFSNIFCTPLSSHLSFVQREVKRLWLTGGVTNMTWFKYFALNLCPIWGGEEGDGDKKIGTVEFRHMAGTTDVSRIIEWINLIVSLKITAKKFNTKDLLAHLAVMNTTSGYNWLVQEVFKEWSYYLTSQPTFKKDVEQGILNAKQVAFHKEKADASIIIKLGEE